MGTVWFVCNRKNITKRKKRKPKWKAFQRLPADKNISDDDDDDENATAGL